MPAQESQFEISGYFVSYWDVKLGKALGTLKVEKQDRVQGEDGMRVETLTQSITLTKGHKTVTYVASEKRPLVVETRYFPICGRIRA